MDGANVISETGIVSFDDAGVALGTGSTVWASTLVQRDQPFNWVRCSYQFDGVGDGYVSVYFNDELILLGDQRIAGNALQDSDMLYISGVIEDSNWLSVRTLIKARQWARSAYLDLHEELLAECGTPEGVSVLIEIMGRFPKNEWCSRYMEATGKTKRTYRRHKRLAEQVLACRRHEESCENVRLVVPAPPPPQIAPPATDPLGFGQADIGDPPPGNLDLPNRLRWWINPDNN